MQVGDNVIKSASADRLAAARLVAKPDGRDNWHRENANAKLFLAYMNYAMMGKFGYWLATSPLRIRDNKGETFANTAGHSL